MQIDPALTTPVIEAVGTICATALSTVAVWAISRLAQKLGVEKNAALTAALDDAATKGIHFAVMNAQESIAAKGWDHPDVQNQLVAQGANYVLAKFPDMLSKISVDPSTPEGQQAIRDVVTRALPTAVASAAASPTTPDATPAAPAAGAK